MGWVYFPSKETIWGMLGGEKSCCFVNQQLFWCVASTVWNAIVQCSIRRWKENPIGKNCCWWWWKFKIQQRSKTSKTFWWKKKKELFFSRTNCYINLTLWFLSNTNTQFCLLWMKDKRRMTSSIIQQKKKFPNCNLYSKIH